MRVRSNASVLCREARAHTSGGEVIAHSMGTSDGAVTAHADKEAALAQEPEARHLDRQRREPEP